MAERILQQDPNYAPNTVFDPPRFISIIESIRKPVTSLVTASRQVEPITEAPVPVTVITEEMILTSGARNLKELLSIYVPGMTAVEDHNELNIAMRGVYASSQQKILIMLNGHRLNSRAYSEANPDFGISLNKIKQIEVLRGPASSLYGNVALTSVINLITKKGQDVDGVKVSAGVGNFGQVKADLLLGKQFNRSNDILIWGSYYQSNGEDYYIPKEQDHSPDPTNGYAILGGFKDRPSYDAGMVYNQGSFSLMGNLRYCKYTEPFSSGGMTGEVYDYGAYRTFQGIGPGLSSSSSHAEVKYGKDLRKGWDIMAVANLDLNAIEGCLVINPAIGQSGKVFWNEISYGGVIQLTKKYDFASLGNGNILAGMQIDDMKLIDSFYLLGINGQFDTTVDNSKVPLLEKGKEAIYSGFVQIKHRLGQKVILNLGARYDNKKRHMGKNIEDFSPRLSVIFAPSPRTDIKLSYAQSFVDAPYWYRYNSLPSYKGSANLLPEHLQSVQFTTNFRFLENKCNVGFNIFYNKLRDFIYRDPHATGDMPRYKNAGRLESTGMEGEVAYLASRVKIRANTTWQYAIKAQDYGVTGFRINNIPEWSGNFILDMNPFFKKYNGLWINLIIHYVGKELSPVNTYLNGELFNDPNLTVDPVAIVNAGFHLPDLRGFSLDFNIYNLFGTEYQQGGSTNFPYPQEDRWFLMTAGYKF
jgi:iron complex outermembrane receptor protein